MGKEVLVTDYLSSEMIEAGQSILEHLDPAELVGEDVFWLKKNAESDWQLVFSSPGASFTGFRGPYEYLQKILASIPKDQKAVRLDQIVVLDTNSPYVLGLRYSLSAPFQRSHYSLNKVWLGDAYFEGVYVYRLAETVQITCDLVLDADTESLLRAREGNRLGGGDVYVWAEGLSDVPDERIIAHGMVESGENIRVVIDMPEKYGIKSCEGLRCESFRPGKASVLGTRWGEGPMTLSVNHVKLTSLS